MNTWLSEILHGARRSLRRPGFLLVAGATLALHDGRLDPLFQAVADSCEQAILHALWQATPVVGRDGHRRATLTELLPDWPRLAP